ncbi:MAG: wax ester/triacylglycerol synthase family O-acyltransferase [Alphaproteobacteria bacterium]|nr:wax ester/triacylglycerol synthase family O-acyltransferase [Alphaproteobacteria bacterium]
MEQLSPLDASFLFSENERVANHIGGLYIYDQSTVPGGALRFRQILRYLEARLHKTPRLRQKLARVPLDLDYPYWVDDSRFDIEYHVRHLALPKPGDWRQLCILASRLHDRPLDLHRPLWALYVIEGLDNVEGLPPDSFAIVTKLHHAALDGVSAVSTNTSLHETEPGLRIGQALPWTPEPEPSPLDLLFRAHLNYLAQPFRLLNTLAESVPAQTRFLASFGEESFTSPRSVAVPRTRFNRDTSGRRVINGISYDLPALRRIKEALPGATVNDVMLALTGGALRRYLKAKNDLPDEAMVALVPVSVRSPDAEGPTGNEVIAMLASLGTDEADPRRRLEAVHTSTFSSKALTNAIGTRLLTDYQQFLPAATSGMFSRFFAQMRQAGPAAPAFNTVLTNVPGPQHPLFFCGARLVNQYGLGMIQDGVGLFHTVFSYDGKLTLTAVSDREMMPDPEFYMSCFRDSFEELRAATRPAPRPRPKAATAPARA